MLHRIEAFQMFHDWEELSHLVQDAFMGSLVTDGYAVYRSHPKRQRCLAHLIRKEIAITGAINQKAAQITNRAMDFR